jgi:N-acetylglucosaminyl-diphospho-decaprenol L-rhamnosyltransferase
MTTPSTERLRDREASAGAAGLTATVIVPTVTPESAVALLSSLARSGAGFETIVVDNGTGDAALDRAVAGLENGQVMRLDSNLGYSRAVNQAARRAQGDVLVLLNDDSDVDPGFVERITAPIDPAAGVVMAAGVMRDAVAPDLIETAGIELDRTLLAFDYLNGEPLNDLDDSVADPIGPSGAAAAFQREAFLDIGGFDESLFAYLEDVDLALRLARAGASCRLARAALGTHQHSTTLGSGSRRKDYLMGYGRGYLLRKWSVISARRLPGILVRELVMSAGQAVVDRNLGGAAGRVAGLRAGRRTEPFPGPDLVREPTSFLRTLGRRRRRRARMRRGARRRIS